MATILELKHVSKIFPGVLALNDVNLKIEAGEIHALLGENGAGKSTLVKILSGDYRPSHGEILFQSNVVNLGNPAQAQRLGITVIHQEFNLFPNLSVRENIAFYLSLNSFSSRPIDWRKLDKQVQSILTRMGITLPLRYKIKYLNVADQQLVEIAKALILDAKIIIMDEPTAALTSNEINKLFQIIRTLKEKGVTIIFISHRLDEAIKLSDQVSVLRDGSLVATRNTREIDERTIAKMITGKDVTSMLLANQAIAGNNKDKRETKVILEARNLSCAPYYRDINFQLHQGEILGILGPLGAGKTELGLTLFGVLSPTSGEIVVEGRPMRPSSPSESMRHSIVYLPEDRQRYGVLHNMTVMHNLTTSILGKISSLGIIDAKKQQAISSRYVKLLNIKTPSLNQDINYLSGGNIQKVIIGRWLATQPKILILDQPTRGLDVGAKDEVKSIVRDLSEKNLSIIYLSMEVPEILEVCDRVLVLREGRIIRELSPSETTRDELTAITLGKTE
jgi:ABC-type sugar transport system ATPase subunit